MDMCHKHTQPWQEVDKEDCPYCKLEKAIRGDSTMYDTERTNFKVEVRMLKHRIEDLKAEVRLLAESHALLEVQVERLEKALTILRDDPYCDAEMIIKVALEGE